MSGRQDPVDRGPGDPNDLIVGTIRPPAWLAGIPPAAWLFIALAVVAAAVRFTTAADFRPGGPTAFGLAVAATSAVAAAATQLLPAALLAGWARRGTLPPWLFAGTLLIAAAQLADLFIEPVVRSLAVDWAGPEDLVVLIAAPAAVGVLETGLTIVGLILIGRGLGTVAPEARSIGGLQLGVGWAIAVGSAAGWLQALRSSFDSEHEVVLLGLNVAIAVGSVATVLLWLWLAAVAGRRVGGPWPAIRAGSLAVALGETIVPVAAIVATALGSPDVALSLVTWAGLTASSCTAVGLVMLAIGLKTGPGTASDATTQPELG